MTLKRIILGILILCATICKSQKDTIFFSVTGDTILYSPNGVQPANSDTIRHTIIIASFNPIDTIKIISEFEISTPKNGNPYKQLSVDTLKKYGLQFDGVKSYTPDKNIKLIIKPRNVKYIAEVYDDSGEKIYEADIDLTIKCKSKIIRKETIKYTYQGTNEKDYSRIGICYLAYWKKSKKDKYLIFYSIARGCKITSTPQEHISTCEAIISYIDYY